MKSLILLFLFTLTAFAKGPQPRLSSQSVTIFGDVGSVQSLTFQKSRKNVTSAVLHVTTSWQWDYVSFSGPTDTVTIDYENTQTIAGNVNVSASQAVVPFGYAPPSSYQFSASYDVAIDPASLTGTGTLVLPVVTSGSAVVEVGYAVNQIPRFITTGVLEYTTGR